MPKFSEGSTARNIVPASQERSRPKLRIVEHEREVPAEEVSDTDLLESLKEHERAQSKKIQDPNKAAEQAMEQYKMLMNMGRTMGELSPEKQQEVVEALREAKIMLENRQQWIQAGSQPNQEELNANLAKIHRMEQMLEIANQPPEIALKQHTEATSAKEEKRERKELPARLTDARTVLKHLTIGFTDEYGIAPSDIATDTEGMGLIAKAKLWLLRQRAANDLDQWRDAQKTVSRLEGMMRRRSMIIEDSKEKAVRIQKKKMEIPEPVLEANPTLKESVQRGQRKAELSKIGMEVLRPMDLDEAKRYLERENAKELWDFTQAQIDAIQDKRLRNKVSNFINAFQEGDDAEATKFAFEIARLHKAERMHADANVRNLITERLNKAAELLGIDHHPLFESALAYRAEAPTNVTRSVRQRKADSTARDARFAA